MYKYLSNYKDSGRYNFAMVGYVLGNTLSENGHVARGICNVDENGYLKNVVERTHIEKTNGGAHYTEDNGTTWTDICIDSIVSMNMWGFTQSFLDEACDRFPKFLDESLKTNPLKCEYYLPSVVSQLLDEKKACVQVLRSTDKWYGVTYQADKEVVVNAINQMHNNSKYPTPLWDKSMKCKYNITLNDALNGYHFGEKITRVYEYGEGHINDTYCVCALVDGINEERYILQRINSNVFNEPIKLMDNIVNVTTHLKSKIIKNGGEYLRETLNVINTKDDKSYYIDSNGAVWRVFNFINDIFCLQSVEKPEHFYESARSFGNFLRQLDDFPAETLYETIPRFHDTQNRLKDLKLAVKEDKLGRAKLVKKEIEFVLSRENDCSYLMNKLKNGELPLRVTHNDTKLNNILMDKKTGKGICVVDLDTIMPGICANDFGDSIRFGATTAAEDEVDVSKMHFDIELFKVYTQGYLEATGDILTDEEKKSLVWGSKLMTLECGIRFLTDYLNGDTYFKI